MTNPNDGPAGGEEQRKPATPAQARVADAIVAAQKKRAVDSEPSTPVTDPSQAIQPLTPKTERLRLAVVLGSGGARGYAHVGALEEIVARGHEIIAIAGCSMGALVGGMYAAGKMDAFKAWATTLDRLDLFRLMDFTLTARGAIRGDRFFAKVFDLIGDIQIENLPIDYTAVATEILHQREVWFQQGSLLDAIRASVAIPSLIAPFERDGKWYVDGGLLNPLPIIPTISAHADRILAVNLSFADIPGPELLGNFPVPQEEEPGLFDLMNLSFETMQGVLTQYKLAGYSPDILVNIPKKVCKTFDYHRAADLIELGRLLTARVLDQEGL